MVGVWNGVFFRTLPTRDANWTIFAGTDGAVFYPRVWPDMDDTLQEGLAITASRSIEFRAKAAAEFQAIFFDDSK